jgi:hypothetical protein
MLTGEVLALVRGDPDEDRILEELVQIALVDQLAGTGLVLERRPGLRRYPFGAQFPAQGGQRDPSARSVAFRCEVMYASQASRCASNEL